MDVRHACKRAVFALLPEYAQEAIDRAFYYRRARLGLLSREDEMNLLPDIIRTGDVVLDVGANLGAYTLRLSDLVGASGEVHAFEPVPRTFRLLTYNVSRLARHRNVQLHRVALSDTTGIASLYVPTEGQLQNFYTPSLRRSSDDAVPITVPTLRLDDWAPRFADRRISLIKIDVEGAELQVLAGAEAILRATKPVVLCEVTRKPEQGTADPDVFRLLASIGYCAFRYRDAALEPCSEPDELPMPNYVFKPKDVLRSA